MSNLLDQAITDNKNILDDTDRAFSVNITLTNLESVSQVVPGFIIRTTQEIDPETQIPYVSEKTAVNIHLSNIEGTPLKNWLVKFTDYSGVEINGRVIKLEREKTLGYVSLILGV